MRKIELPARFGSILSLWLASVLFFMWVVPAQSLDFSNDLVLYQENFNGEVAFPVTPEVDEIAAGGLSEFGTTLGGPSVPPALTGTGVHESISLSAGPFVQGVAFLSNSIGTESFNMRGEFLGLSASSDAEAFVQLVSSVDDGEVDPGSIEALLYVNGGTMGSPAAFISVAEEDGISPTGYDNFLSVDLPAAEIAALLAGAAFVLDCQVDRVAETAIASIDIDSFPTHIAGPMSFIAISNTGTFVGAGQQLNMELPGGVAGTLVEVDFDTFQISQTAPAPAIEWVTVGDPGNPCDTQSQGCFGSVAEPYRISKFEISNAQYTEFLNSVAATDTNTLYHSNMALVSNFGGVTRSGISGSYSYTTIAGRENMPVNWVSFWDATRFANWLHNGQPTGAQDNTTTEDGAYALTPFGMFSNSIARKLAAEAFLPTEDEWYKAAYYDPGAMIYFSYPAGSNVPTTCAIPETNANTANCGDVVADLTDVGSYAGAASPSGTFDQGGNVSEWNEAILGSSSDARGSRGGGFVLLSPIFSASIQLASGPFSESDRTGFRIASPVPPPPVPSLAPLAMVMLWGLLVLLGCRSIRA